MNLKCLVGLIVSSQIAIGALQAEVPAKLLEQAIADATTSAKSKGKVLTDEMRHEILEELKSERSPLNLSPTTLKEYEAGKLAINSLVLQETVRDTLQLVKTTKIELPFLAKYYLDTYLTEELNAEQSILCYLSLKVVQRKILVGMDE